jgi:hypothetical protein
VDKARRELHSNHKTRLLRRTLIDPPASRQSGIMSKHEPRQTALDRPLLTLTVIFVLWKAVLVLVVLASPGPGYDTSTTLLDWHGEHSLLAKFVRWDAIYFTQITQWGRVHEQQWAWGIGHSAILTWSSRGQLLEVDHNRG